MLANSTNEWKRHIYETCKKAEVNVSNNTLPTGTMDQVEMKRKNTIHQFTKITEPFFLGILQCYKSSY